VWRINYRSLPKHPVLSLKEERQLIAQAKMGYKAATEELVLRYVGFIIFRLQKVFSFCPDKSRHPGFSFP